MTGEPQLGPPPAPPLASPAGPRRGFFSTPRSGSCSPRIGREQGAALVFALFVLLLLGVSLALLALSMRVRLEEQQREVRRVRLELLLDGVVAETLGRLALDPRFGGVASRPAAAGEAWSAVETVGPTLARVRAGAALGARRVSATVVVRIAPGPPRIVAWRRGLQ